MESDLIAWLRAELPPHPCLRLGIGDDAALVQLGSGSDCVVTVDIISDQVDFRLDQIDDPRRVGHKALGVNLSDLAAMAAIPRAAVVGLALPRQTALALAKSLYRGILPLAERFDMAIAGGDTHVWDGPLLVSITAIGAVGPHGLLYRQGAKPGDQLLVTGQLGGSLLGRHLDLEPRVREALLLNDRYDLHAAIDISDGLAIDLARLADASECGAVIELAQVPVSPAAKQLAATPGDARTPLEHALSDGEDFELLLAVPPATAEQLAAEQPLEVPLTRIGRCITQPGLWQQDTDGQRRPLPPVGYLH
jgi:thiamine-monophosphate kinase